MIDLDDLRSSRFCFDPADLPSGRNCLGTPYAKTDGDAVRARRARPSAVKASPDPRSRKQD